MHFIFWVVSFLRSGVFFSTPFIYDDIDLNLYVFLALFTAGTFFSVIYRNALSSVNILLDRYSYVKYLFAAQLVTLCLWVAIIFLDFLPKQSVYWLFVVSLAETLILVPILDISKDMVNLI